MAVPGYVLKNRRTTLERAEKFISDKYFTDCNLFGRLYPKRCPFKSLRHYAAPGRIDFSAAVKGSYGPASVGQSFGPTWSTHWFEVEVEVPQSWVGEEVRLIWDSETEAMVWKDGVPLQGLSPESQRTDFILSRNLQAAETRNSFYIEMACNKLFGAGEGFQIAAPNPNCQYTLLKAELAVMDRDVYALLIDLEVIIDLVKSLPEDSNRGYQGLYVANDIVNTVVIDNHESYRKAHAIAERFFAEANGKSQHSVIAIGNCHIDTAWLWPYEETKRKCARSFSAAIRLLEDYPETTFACSQAQQFEWVKENYPSLYEKMKVYIAKGRFIPVGGTWVEMDGYVPSGEAFVRQFLQGQKLFKREFGIICTEFWLPDTFGYSAQLPQIMKLVGITRFVTQKISWNLVNKFPHHTFWWSSIDGTKVLTHFPPGDSYCMKGKVEELVRTVKNFQDKGRSNSSLCLYGFGDGGQGPTENIIERLNRLKDCDGIAKVKHSTPSEYFRAVEETDVDKLCTWSGELYLELHNGTYTTQALVKMNNRKSELLLHDLEAIASMVLLVRGGGGRGGFEYPAGELERMWKLVLLNQFHDVLPGTSINLAYEDVMKFYADVRVSASSLLLTSAKTLLHAGKGDAEKGSAVPCVLNTHSWERAEVVVLSDAQISAVPSLRGAKTSAVQTDKGDNLVLVKALSFGFSRLETAEEVFVPATAEQKGDDIHLKNGKLEAVLDKSGRITGLYLNGSKRNGIATGCFGNQMVIFDDVPLYWDAWDVMDYHLETRKPVVEAVRPASIAANGPLRASVEVSIRISDVSHIKQIISLDADSPYLQFHTEVEWHESHKFLKVEFQVDVVSPEATYEIQFGHLRRPTHFNTSWDWAKFEVCGHKWADLSEYNYGVAVLNDCKYGWSCINNVLRLSLLRSPKSPDEFADMGVHSFTYALMPHTGTFQSAGVIQAAYNLNNRLRVVDVASAPSQSQSFVTIDEPAVVLEAVKQAEDKSNAVVLRFYEAYGSHVSVNIKLPTSVTSAQVCDLLERPTEGGKLSLSGNTVQLAFRPFQIMSLLLHF